MFLLLALCLLFSQNGGKSIGGNETNKQQQDTQSAAPATQNPAVEPINKTEPVPAAYQGANQQSQALKAADKWIIMLNTLMVIVFGFQAYIANQQRQIMKAQESRTEISERAYVGVKGVHWESYEIGKVPVIRVVTLNGGRTPAWKLKAPATIRIGQEFPIERPALGDAIGSAFLPSGIEITYSFPLKVVLTPQWKNAIDTGERRIFVHGEYHYEDCWGKAQIVPFQLVYKYEHERWGEYKDPKYAAPIVSIKP